MAVGVDTTGALDPAAMKSAGYTFVCRYLSNSSWKNLIMPSSPYNTELVRYLNGGVGVVFNWEATGQITTTNHPGDPYGQGHEDATRAQDQAAKMGYPNAPIYFSIDYDLQPAAYAGLRSYFQAINDVIGRARTGVYGGYYVVGVIHDSGLATYYWQTRGWSTVGGVKYTLQPYLHLGQRLGTVTVSGTACDVDDAYQTDFGQIPRPGVVAPPPVSAPPVVVTPPPPPTTLGAGNYGGTNLSTQQAENASTIIRAAKARNKSDNVAASMIVAALQEASLLNLNYGTGTSLGIFQLIAAHGTAAQRMDITFSSNWWLDQADIKAPVPQQDTMAPDALAQLVEVSGNASAYTKWVATGRAVVAAFNTLIGAAPTQTAPPPVVVTTPPPGRTTTDGGTQDPNVLLPATNPTDTNPSSPSSVFYPGRVIYNSPKFTSYTPESELFTAGALDDTSGWSLSTYAEASLRGTATTTARIVAYTALGGVRYNLPFADGTVTYDSGQSVGFRQAKISVSDPELWPDEATHPLAPMGTELSIEYGFGLPDGNVEWIPLIRGPITDVSTSFPQTEALSVTIKDRSAIVADDRFDTARSTDTSETIVNAITRMIHETLPNCTVSDFTGDTTKCPQADLQQDRWAAVQKLAGSIGAQCYADRLGNFVIRKQATLARTPRWMVNSGADGVLIKADKGFSRDNTYNRFYVSGQSTQTTDAGGNTTNTVPPHASAVDDNPTHAGYYGGPFGKKTRFYTSPFITTTQQAQNVANAMLARYAGGYASVSLEHAPNPALDPGDVVLVKLEDQRLETHIIDSMSIPLLPTGTQSLKTRVQALPDETVQNDASAPVLT